jgi:tRNA dimethylallyltransferase
MISSDGLADNSLRIIVGPTAAGKSALALELATTFRGAIVGADSRHIYRGFDIGTGKPNASECAVVPHYGIDVAEPSERWSAARYADAAAVWLSVIESHGRVPVVVGGTGFWVSALVAPLAPIPALDPARRAAIDAYLTGLPLTRVREWCEALDRARARLGPVQWRRAIEVALLTGRRLSAWQSAAPRSGARAVRYLVIDPGEALDELIARRVDTMLAAGWADEVRALMARVPAGAVAWKACGYALLRDAVLAGAPAESVRDEIVRETRRYARRQRTWFRRQLTHGPVTRVDPTAVDATARARAWWNGDDGA